MANSNLDQPGEFRRASIKKLDAAGWGVFFIWIGIAFLADVGWGAGLIGTGIIMLGVQAGRRYFNLPAERFGLVMGVLFVAAGMWELLTINLGREPVPDGLIPVLSIVAGLVLVASALLRNRH